MDGSRLSRGFWGLVLCGTLVSGCASSGRGGPSVGLLSPKAIARSSAAAFLQGRSNDAMADADRRGDYDAKLAARATYEAASHAGDDPTRAAELVIHHVIDRGRTDSGSVDQDKEDALEDLSYRTALRIQPKLAETSSDALALNALGYHLADKGNGPDDFKEAEKVLRRAVQLWDRQIADLPKNSDRRGDFHFARAIGPLDSLAWALYKQGRLDEARKLEEEVIRTPMTVGDPDQRSARSEVLFHMGEIYRALKMYRLATDEYEAALNSDPKDDIRTKVKKSQALIPDGYAPPDPAPQVNA